jgi:hypothetical protein
MIPNPVQVTIPAHRIFTHQINIAGVRPDSVVMVSLTEMGRPNPTAALAPILGEATMKVYNVTPGNGRVSVRGEVDWDSDLEIQISIAIFT